MFHGITRPSTRLASSTVSLLILTGGLILVALLYEWSVLGLSLAALMTQIAALLLAVGYRLWRLSARFLIYPVILFGTIYLWDTNLPPPNLPDGSWRALVPLVVIAALIVDLARTARRFRQAAHSGRGFSVIGGYVSVDEAAALFEIQPQVLRSRLKRAACSVIVAFDGREYVAWPELQHVLAQEVSAGGNGSQRFRSN